ncbi:MAG TPA: nitroreductase/quinone reductase family protein [Solirubrobacterales bacterium]|nr:nitroreductase/quinone reductase family protein [Solirubrobacterales bacterium]
MPSDHFWATLSNSLGAKGLRLVGKLNAPVYRLTRGRIGGRVGGAPILLLTTTGRKSGRQRTAPVLFIEDDGRLAVIDTNAGTGPIPAWSLNLKANPEAVVEIGKRRLAIRARPAEGEERADLWRKHNEQYAGFDEYEEKLDPSRPITVYVLEPAER